MTSTSLTPTAVHQEEAITQILTLPWTHDQGGADSLDAGMVLLLKLLFSSFVYGLLPNPLLLPTQSEAKGLEEEKKEIKKKHSPPTKLNLTAPK